MVAVQTEQIFASLLLSSLLEVYCETILDKISLSCECTGEILPPGPRSVSDRKLRTATDSTLFPFFLSFCSDLMEGQNLAVQGPHLAPGPPFE